MATSSQKFVARNRAPRVQIEYDVELYGAQKKVQLPFIMGVLADLSGKPADPLAPVADRKFLEVDTDNFDTRMKAMKPRAAFSVPNALTGEGDMKVDITFESMDDFSPANVARKVDSLNKLLEARTLTKFIHPCNFCLISSTNQGSHHGHQQSKVRRPQPGAARSN